MNKIVAIGGLAGCGKTEATNFFVEKGFHKVYFGAITFEELKKRKLEVNEKNARMIREELRQKYGMAAYAILNLSKIKETLKKGNVVIESLYSWDEYLLLKKEFGENFKMIAIFASPATRIKRLANRSDRAHTKEELVSRDYSQIENLAIGGPLARADFTVVNEGTLDEFRSELEKIFNKL